MQIVIDIPDRMYQNVLDGTYCGTLYEELKNGTPLPKGHGRILDEKDILDIEKNKGLIYDLVDMPEYLADVSAIIEADREVEEREQAEAEDQEWGTMEERLFTLLGKEKFEKELKALVNQKCDEINHYISGCDSPFTFTQIKEIQCDLQDISNILEIKHG